VTTILVVAYSATIFRARVFFPWSHQSWSFPARTVHISRKRYEKIKVIKKRARKSRRIYPRTNRSQKAKTFWKNISENRSGSSVLNIERNLKDFINNWTYDSLL